MPRNTRWSQLLPGVLALFALVALGTGVLLFARVGALRGETFRLYAPTSEARGVIKGTEVWLAGQKIGLVDDVRFQPPSVDTTARVVLVLDVLTSAADQIRGNSFAQIRTGGTMIGAPVVFITSGSVGVPQLADGDTLATRPQSDAEGLTSQLALASRDLPPIIDNLRQIGAQLNSARGSAGAILNFDPNERELEVLQQRAGRLTRSVTAGQGSLGLALRGDLGVRTRRILARVDSVSALVAAGRNGGAGRASSDSALLNRLRDLQNEVSITRALMSDSRGTLGRAAADSAIALQLAQFERELAELIRDVKERPLRYVAF